MRPFWRSFWASILAYFSIALIFILIIVLIVVFSFDNDPITVKEKSVLHIILKDPITEKSFSELNPMAFSINNSMGIREIKMAIENAKTDDNIKGIYLNAQSVAAGMASVEEIRNALIDFKTSKKFILAYSEVYTQKSYYLATAADELYLFQEGMIDFRGLSAELIFLKGMIDKLGVDVQIIRGSNNKFKSAVEPLMLDSMSDANREQTLSYMDDLWGQMLKGISETRDLSIAELNEIADSVYVRNAETAVEYGLIDELMYQDEITEILKKKSKTDKDDDLNLFSFNKYVKLIKRKKDSDLLSKDENIAVVYAVGSIESGKGGPSTIGSDAIAESIMEARTDDDIKAIVLRINSPGGSALASDVIWREVILCKEAGKPVVVSMGDVAASGGYYIACAADKIYAHPNTITGSIGVFGVIPNFGPMLEEKLGVTTSVVETNAHANLGVLNALTEKEKDIIQDGVDDIYDDFITKVSEGRGIPKAMVDSIGQGRVWSGADAIKIDLVDELGGIDEAIAYAAEKAKIKTKDIRIKPLPDWSDDFTNFLEEMSLKPEKEDQSEIVQKYYQISKSIEMVTKMEGVQARLPYFIEIK